MEYRRLGASGLNVPALAFGAGTFGGSGPLFGAWGSTDAAEARRLVDICLDAGVTLFDTADVYSAGASEEVLGQAVKGRRERVLLSTKASLPTGDGPNEAGSSRSRLIEACEAALRRLGTEHIDLFQLHAFDAGTPIEEVLSTLDDLVRAGKVRYVGVSNFAGWQLMKSLAVAERHNLPRYVAHQVYYSLVGRDYEWDLLPLGRDQGVGALVWSPLGWGRSPASSAGATPCPRGAGCTRPPSTVRRSTTSTSSAWSTPSTRWPRRPGGRCRRSRSTGCSSAPRWRRSSSARATRPSCGKTLARSAGASLPSRWPGSTRQAYGPRHTRTFRTTGRRASCASTHQLAKVDLPPRVASVRSRALVEISAIPR
ncbi:aldo/keto reductase [Phytohabitans flavus]